MASGDSLLNFKQDLRENNRYTCHSNFVDSNMMVLEETPTADSLPLTGDHSKDCLKFCRKISRVLIKIIKPRESPAKELIEYNSMIMHCILGFLDIKDIEKQLLDELQYDCLLEAWTRFKDFMSYSKNKKICIVKSEHWNLIFAKKPSMEYFKTIVKELAQRYDNQIVVATILRDPIFLETFTRMLYSANYMLTFVCIMKDNSPRGIDLRNLQTLNNFIVLMLQPELFPYYNNKRGKFALECCGKCKVCCSRELPKDFLQLLNEARRQSEILRWHILQIMEAHQNIGYAESVMEFAYSQF